MDTNLLSDDVRHEEESGVTESAPARGSTLQDQFRRFSEATTMLRQRGAYGKKLDRRWVNKTSEYGEVSVFHYDEATDQATVETVQDVEPIILANKREFNEGDGWNADRTMRHVARIPNVVVARMFQAGINPYREEDWPKVAAMLDHPDFRFFRTSPGTISRRTPREYSQVKEGFDRRKNFKLGRLKARRVIT